MASETYLGESLRMALGLGRFERFLRSGSSAGIQLCPGKGVRVVEEKWKTGLDDGKRG